MNLLRALTSPPAPQARAIDPLSADDFLSYFTFGGNWYGAPYQQTMLGEPRESVGSDFLGLVHGVYRRNGVVAACMFVRQRLFSEARFQFRALRGGRPGALFGTAELAVLEQPWPGGTTGDMLVRAIQDADLAGNAFLYRTFGGDRIRRLRPDWTTIVLGSDETGEDALYDPNAEVVGYLYQPGGKTAGRDPIALRADEVAHFAPIPDPEAAFRGMSWLTPVIREILADGAAQTHKQKFFEHGGAPSMVVVFKNPMKRPDFDDQVKTFRDNHEGAANAYKCLHPSTEVALWNGARCRADEIRVGDTIVAWAEGRPVPGVVSQVETQPPAPIVTVTTQRGRTIKTNDRHPFLTRVGWVDAKDLRKGDLLVTGLGWGRPRFQDALTCDEAWLLGLLVGDGCFVRSSPTVTVSAASTRSRLKGVADIVKTDNPRGPYDYRVRGIADLVRGAGLNGKRAWEKRVPACVMSASVEIVGAFLAGLIDADGHVADSTVRASAEIGLTSTSHALLADVQYLLASVGVNASISQPPSMRVGARGGGSGVPRRHDAYRLCIFGNDQARRLSEFVHLTNEEKCTRLATFAAREAAHDRSRFDRVASVTLGQPEPTIGIEVAEHHTHVTGGVVTHNTLFLGAGADITVVGSDLKQLDFAVSQGMGEVRITAAAGVPAIIAGIKAGLDASTYSNFGQARRQLADGTLRPLWRNIAGSLQTIVPPPPGSELWYDGRDIAFLKDDVKDAAEARQRDATSISTLVMAGYEPDSVVAAVVADDLGQLVHTGMPSVQLQPAGSANGAGPGDGAAAARDALQLLAHHFERRRG